MQVQAGGSTPLGYQWLFNDGNLAGATSSELALNSVQTSQAGGYIVVITNSVGSITSAVATLTVLVPPTITLQPTNQTVVAGSSATFQGNAAGSAPLSYQWFLSSNALAGATDTALLQTNVQAAQAGNYSFVVTNTAGAATSVVAQLTVLTPPSITIQPTNQTVADGSNVSFQVSASGSWPLSYQWWFNGTNAVGTNSNSLTVANAQSSQAGAYNVVITNSAGSVTSMVATLTIGTPPAITQQPGSTVVVQGQSASFNAGASGDAPLTYQWRFNGTPIGAASANSYTVVAATPANAGNYDAVVSNAYGSSTTAVAQLTVLVPPAISSQPSNQTALAGSNIGFQVTATGSAPLGYQWWFNGTNAVGASTNALTITNAQSLQAGAYNVVITNSAGSVTSMVATLTIGVPPSIAQQPSNLSVVQGQSATFSVLGTGDTPLSYQWWFNGTAIGGATASSFTLPSATAASAGDYGAVITNSYGSVTSMVATLTVLVPPSVLSQPTNQTVGPGGTVSFQVTVTGSAPLNYQWWFDGTNAMSGGTNALTITNASPVQAGAYSVLITNAAGAVTSIVATLTIGMPPAITQPPTSLAVIQGWSATFTVAATGDTPLGYQWRFNGSPLGGASFSAYTVSAATPGNAGNYDVVLTNAYGAVTSAVAQLTVLVPPTITTQPTNQIVIAGGNASFQVAVSGSAPFSYQWWFDGTNAFGTDSNILTIAKAQAIQAGTYTVVVTNAAGTVTSSGALLTVLVPPAITIQPTNQVAPPGANVGFYASASGSAPLGFQWTFNGAVIPGATASSLLLSGVQAGQAGNYVLVATNAAGSAASSPASLAILAPPAVSAPIIAGASISVPVSSVTGLSYLLEYKNSLEDPAWTPASAWQPGTGGVLLLQDTNSLGGMRFYRVQTQ